MSSNMFEIVGQINLDVADEAIELCLKLIEIWLNRNQGKRIVGGTRLENGKIEPLRIEDRKHE